MKPPTLLPLQVNVVRRWLRTLLLCALFSALHGTLGAWVVSSINDGPVVQICTPQGMQWVDPGELSGEGSDPLEAADSALQPCVWAGAHVALGAAVTASACRQEPCSAASPTRVQSLAPRSDHARRVLLMSAMRAPPTEAV
jgi:hypothetical protein